MSGDAQDLAAPGPEHLPGIDHAALFSVLPCACAIFSPTLTILAVNEAYLGLTLATRERLVGRPLFDAFPFNPKSGRADLDNVKASLETVLRTHAPHILERQRYDIPGPGGPTSFEERYWDIHNSPVIRDGRVSLVVQRIEDVTELVREIRAAEARVGESVEHAVGVAQVGLDGRFLWANQRLRDLLGYDGTALLSRTVEDVTHPGDRALSRRQVDLLLAGVVPHYTIEKRYVRADGAPVWVGASRSLVRARSGEPDHFVLVVDDISARKAAEAALQDREARLRAILETVPDGVVVFDRQGRVESLSRAAEAMFGRSAGDVVGADVDVLLPDDETRAAGPTAMLDDGTARLRGRGRAAVGRRADGSRFNVHLTVGEARVGDEALFVGFVRDLTEREESEARLRGLQAELAHLARFTGLGAMASALAHELNQPLTAVTGYLRGCRRLLDQDAAGQRGPIGDALDGAAEQALRAGRVLRRLREFVTRRECERRVEDLGTLVEEACGLALVGVPDHGVRMAFRFDPAAPTAYVDRIQFQQVLVNLVRNAVEAMDGPGRKELMVTTEARPGGWVEVGIVDTGPGLAPEVAAKLFQPFVTTKPEGMGVGLSICRTIMEAQGGGIRAEQNPSGGTAFRCSVLANGPAGEEDA